MLTLDKYEELTLNWSKERGITINGKATTQALKLVSEVGELADNIIKDLDCRDDIGDCLVVLTNLAKLKGYTLAECWDKAYNDIKDRKGFLNENGTFIKEADQAYADLAAKVKASPIVDNITKVPHLFGHTLTIYFTGADPIIYDGTLTYAQSAYLNLPIKHMEYNRLKELFNDVL